MRILSAVWAAVRRDDPSPERAHRTYLAGDEAALMKVLDDSDLRRLQREGVIEGYAPPPRDANDA